LSYARGGHGIAQVRADWAGVRGSVALLL